MTIHKLALAALLACFIPITFAGRLQLWVEEPPADLDEALSDSLQIDPVTYEIGDIGPAGGIVFYVTDGGLHGLEAAPEDQDDGSGAEWGCYGTMLYAAFGYKVGTGTCNTHVINMTCPVVDMAAVLANMYSHNGFDDWFLPSRDELYELYRHRDVVGGFAPVGLYWSSTAADGEYQAWFMYFNDGTSHQGWRDDRYHVRAVRKF